MNPTNTYNTYADAVLNKLPALTRATNQDQQPPYGSLFLKDRLQPSYRSIATAAFVEDVSESVEPTYKAVKSEFPPAESTVEPSVPAAKSCDISSLVLAAATLSPN